jgi:hypothetical protein
MSGLPDGLTEVVLVPSIDRRRPGYQPEKPAPRAHRNAHFPTRYESGQEPPEFRASFSVNSNRRGQPCRTYAGVSTGRSSAGSKSGRPRRAG